MGNHSPGGIFYVLGGRLEAPQCGDFSKFSVSASGRKRTTSGHRQRTGQPQLEQLHNAIGARSKGGEAIAWIRTTLQPPLLEHLSFRLGNQLVFVFVVAEGVTGPSSREAFEAFAEDAKAVPCLLQMKRTPKGFVPRLDGWGLVHSITLQCYDPIASLSDARIPVTAWERHDMALQVVRHRLASERCRVDTWQPNRMVFPSLWFERGGGRYWVVVSAFGPPDSTAPRPGVMDKLKRDLEAHSQGGYFAPVGIYAVNDEEQPDRNAPLYRGRGFAVEYKGLEPA